jgi:hypothetical protein
VFLFGYDTSTIGLDPGMACFAARRVRATGFFSPFAPDIKVVVCFEQQTVMTNELASTATREG